MPASPATLPRELWEHILALALPPNITYHHFPERSAALLAFSTVNSFWRDLAQAELFKHVVLSTPDRARKLVRVLKDERLARKVRTLRVGEVRERLSEDKMTKSEYFQVAELLQRCTELEELWGSGLKDANIEQTGLCATLRSSIWYNCTFDCSSTPDNPYPPSQIRRLGLLESSKTLPPYAISARTFPKLVALALLPDGNPHRTTSLSQESRVFDIDPDLGPQLLATSIDIFTFSRLLLDGFAPSSSLRLLDCGTPFVAESVDDPLKWPSELRFLRFADMQTGLTYLNVPKDLALFRQARTDAVKHLLYHFDRQSPSVRKLEYLSLRPAPFRASQDIRANRWPVEVLQPLCEERGIKLTLEREDELLEDTAFDMGFWNFFARAEKIMERGDSGDGIDHSQLNKQNLGGLKRLSFARTRTDP